MLSPNDVVNMGVESVDFTKLEKAIDDSIQGFHGWFAWEQAIIDGEYPVAVRNQIAQKYKDAGWKYVYHQTSSENGERPGLTEFLFSLEKIPEKIVQGYYKV